MYIDSIELENVRTFATKKKIEFIHPDKQPNPESKTLNYSAPTLPNVNLIFGDNASGKTTILEAIALAALGPTAESSRVSPRPLVRFAPNTRKATAKEKSREASILANIVLHGKEQLQTANSSKLALGSSRLLIRERGELESFEFAGGSTSEADWEKAYESDNELFFAAAYGATRRVEQKSDYVRRRKSRSSFERATRLESVMQEGYPLIPLQSWFTRRKKNKRWKQIVELINNLMGGEHFSFKGTHTDGEFLFTKGGIDIPFRSLSDGYRSFLGWATDLLHHLDSACNRSTQDLTEVSGVVLVDEVDLHLHPKWQMTVVERLAKTFPRLQFIFTSHSPLIAGSVEWMNIVRLQLDGQHRTSVDRFEESIHGLDADQILVSSLFGLESTRATAKRDELHKLTIKARKGDNKAAKQLISAMAKGLEVRK